jgi:dienelactone hydrolase
MCNGYLLLQVPQDINPIKIPSLFVCAESDWMFNSSKRTQSQQILEAKQGMVRLAVLQAYPIPLAHSIAKALHHMPVYS